MYGRCWGNSDTHTRYTSSVRGPRTDDQYRCINRYTHARTHTHTHTHTHTLTHTHTHTYACIPVVQEAVIFTNWYLKKAVVPIIVHDVIVLDILIHSYLYTSVLQTVAAIYDYVHEEELHLTLTQTDHMTPYTTHLLHHTGPQRLVLAYLKNNRYSTLLLVI